MRISRTRYVALAVGAALAAAGGPALAGVPAGSPTPPAWAPTATAATHLANAVSVGTLPPGQPVPVTVALALPDPAAAEAQLVAETTPGNPQYRRYLTPAEWTARFAPSAAQATAVATYLSGAGLSRVTVSANRLDVTAVGSAGQVSRAFDTTLGLFRVGGALQFANTAPALVPAALGGVVRAVLGLNSAAWMHSFLAHPAAGTPVLSGFSPAQFPTIYDAAGTPPATNTSIAIIAEGNLTGVVQDLRAEEAADNLPQVPVTIVPTGAASTDTSAADEFALDTQVSGAMAGDVKQMYLYDAPSLADADLVTEINDFATQDLAQAGSASLGECELSAQQDGAMAAIDASLLEAASQGQTFFASSDDTGGACPVLTGTNGIPDAGIPATVSYPASSTYATGVGGTTLFADSAGTYEQEIGWIASGGGVSLFEKPAPWTATADPVAPLLGGVAGRGVPDIAMDADPLTGANVIVSGARLTIGGTSLASPLALGAWARIQSDHANTLGDAAPAFYGLYSAAHSGLLSAGTTPGFHDIVLGTNGLYVCLPGYDFVTGIGTIDVGALNGALR
ncbi:MAG: S53 family peptidase [Acidimicrobiales bacterium]